MGGSNEWKFYVNGVDIILLIYKVCDKAWLWIVPMKLQVIKVGGDSTFQDPTCFKINVHWSVCMKNCLGFQIHWYQYILNIEFYIDI